MAQIGVGGDVAQRLEGVAPVAQVVRPLCELLELERGDLGAVLGAFEVAHLGNQLVDRAVEALDLGVQHVGEAPEQRLELVMHLGALDGDALDHDRDGFGQRELGFRAVPGLAGVEVVPVGVASEQSEVVADGCGGGDAGHGGDLLHRGVPCVVEAARFRPRRP